MAKFGLALSGGGFRATLFHLGVVRFLRDAGALPEISDIAAVSGGSILAAHLVLNWDKYNSDDQGFAEAAAQIVRFVQFDVRNHIVRRLPLLYLYGLLSKLSPWSGPALSANTILERYYAAQLYGDRCLHELPESPKLHILATNVSNGGLSVFNRDGLYIQQRDGPGPSEFKFVSAKMASIPKVVGASSAFPGFFPPVEITAADLGVREGKFPTEWFTDGGVYDNLGIRTFSWLRKTQREFDQILVSDAGKPFQVLTNAALGLIGQSTRATDILWDRVGQLERENFSSSPEFLFVSVTGTVDPQDDPTALHAVVQPEVQSIRTDLDRFTHTEINALVMHGYEVARKVYRDNFKNSIDRVPAGPPWAPLPEIEAPRRAETGRSTAPATILSRRLRKSSRRRVWSTLLDPRDWPSYLYVAIAALLFLYLPYEIYQLYRREQVQASLIDSIMRGDPDMRALLGLIHIDPTANWIDAKIVEKPEPGVVDNAGFEILTRSRIVDLRGLRARVGKNDDRGSVYVRERLTVKLLDNETGDRRITLRYPMQVGEARFRDSDSPIARTISHVTKPVKIHGEERNVYEVAFDLGEDSAMKPVTLEIEVLIPGYATEQSLARGEGSHKFATDSKTDLVSVWLLFPTERPYRTYNLVRYGSDRKSPPEIMESRFTIDHPYGTLIGWSVINPKLDTIYECRWSRD